MLRTAHFVQVSGFVLFPYQCVPVVIQNQFDLVGVRRDRAPGFVGPWQSVTLPFMSDGVRPAHPRNVNFVEGSGLNLAATLNSRHATQVAIPPTEPCIKRTRARPQHGEAYAVPGHTRLRELKQSRGKSLLPIFRLRGNHSNLTHHAKCIDLAVMGYKY